MPRPTTPPSRMITPIARKSTYGDVQVTANARIAPMMMSAMLPPMVTGPPLVLRHPGVPHPSQVDYPFRLKLPPFTRPLPASEAPRAPQPSHGFTRCGWSRWGRCADTRIRGSTCAAALDGRAARPADGGDGPDHRRTRHQPGPGRGGCERGAGRRGSERGAGPG